MSEPKKETPPRRRMSKVDMYLPNSVVESVTQVPWSEERLAQMGEKKGHALQFRARPTLRAKIDEAAAAAGRSVSEEIEHRLSQSFEAEAADRHIAAMLSAVIGLIEKK